MSDKLNASLLQLKSNPDPLESVFTKIFCQDSLSKVEVLNHPTLTNKLVSIKSNIDVKNYISIAGSKLFSKKAEHDADVVTKLKQNGATLFAHTNMTEFAYSGLGINPHYGTPKNIFDASCIPGGSTSGGAISVATNMVDIAIGTDTGGSLRIPAAFNGLVGFKPTQNTVSRNGCLPLSYSLDSIGPIAKSVEDCKKTWLAINTSNGNSSETNERNVQDSSVNYIVSKNFGFDQLDNKVEQGFENFLAILLESNNNVVNQELSFLNSYQNIPVWQFSSVESSACYDPEIQNMSGEFDPRVLSRMNKSKDLLALDYYKSMIMRDDFIKRANNELQNNILIMPTVAIMPPKFKDFIDDEFYDKTNLLCLRNTSLANVMDGCSISIPYTFNKFSIGIMLTARAGNDELLLTVAQQIENLIHR